MFDSNHILTYAAVGLLALIVHPASPLAAEMCSIRAMGNDPDPAGTNVRSGPGTQYDVIGTLPQFDGTQDISEAFRPEFDVLEIRDGWFKIANAAVGLYGDDKEQIIFEGPGWISAKLATVWVEAMALHAAPETTSPTTIELWSEDFSSEESAITELHGCKGYFVDISVERPDGVTGRGWTDDICANQVTTCV